MIQPVAHPARWGLHTTISGAAALGVVGLTLALGLRALLLGSGQFDYDEGVYWQSLHALRAHPLFASVYSSQPPAFLVLLAPAHRLLGGSLMADRLVVLMVSGCGLVAVYRMLSALDMPWGGLLAAALLGADPLFFRQSVTLQADGPAIGLALTAVALAAATRGRTGATRRLLAAAAGALVATAILTKLLAVAAAPAVAILLVAQPDWRRMAAGQVAAALAGGAAAAAALLLPFVGSWPQMWDQAVGLHIRARTAPTGGLDAGTMLRELPLVALAVAGAGVALRRAPVLLAAGVAWALAAVLVLVAHRPLWPHHVVVLTAPLALLAGATVQLLLEPGRQRHAPLIGLLLVAATLASALYVRSLATPDASRQSSVAALRATTTRHDLVITDDQYSAALASRRTPPELVDTSQVRVLSGELTAEQVEAAAQRWRVRAVLLDTRGMPSLSLLPGFREWLIERFPVVMDVGGGRVLYLRAVSRSGTRLYNA
ncbi:MAG TPA: glycosyltransferase family 39 protein [Candidatus Dormibacteraeota bacterium]